MKFLLFNLAVAAALVFLFTVDRGDVQKIAGQIHDAAGDVKTYANKALKTSQSVLAHDRKMAKRETMSPRTAEPTTPGAQPTAQTAALPVTKPVTSSLLKPPEIPIEPAVSTRLTKNLPATPEPTPEISKSAPADLNPAVAKRRREILDGIDTVKDSTGNGSSGPVVSADLDEGTHLMTATERRKELLSLAEEMELLYARSISQ